MIHGPIPTTFIKINMIVVPTTGENNNYVFVAGRGGVEKDTKHYSFFIT